MTGFMIFEERFVEEARNTTIFINRFLKAADLCLLDLVGSPWIIFLAVLGVSADYFFLFLCLIL